MLKLMLHAVSLALLARLATNCSPDEPPPPPGEQYPILYKYERLDFQAPKLFVLKATGSTEIPANSGSYLYYADEYLKENLDIFVWGFEIEKVELLDDQNAKLHIFQYLMTTPSEIVVPYKTVGDEIQFLEDGEVFMFMQRDADQGTLRICLKATEYTYFDSFFNKIKHSAYDIEHICDEGNPAAAVEAQRARWKLQPADTVLLNYSTWVYAKQ